MLSLCLYCSNLCFNALIPSRSQQNEPIELHIGGLFDFDHPLIDHGQRDSQAAQIAITEINNRRQDLFNNLYTLTLLVNNSRVE